MESHVVLDSVDYEAVYETSRGPAGILAEVEIREEVLWLRDLLIYPTQTDRPLRVGVRDMREVFRSIEREAAMQGFAECLVTAMRLTGARPGRMVAFTRTLR